MFRIVNVRPAVFKTTSSVVQRIPLGPQAGQKHQNPSDKGVLLYSVAVEKENLPDYRYPSQINSIKAGSSDDRCFTNRLGSSVATQDCTWRVVPPLEERAHQHARTSDSLPRPETLSACSQTQTCLDAIRGRSVRSLQVAQHLLTWALPQLPNL